ncbi:MAG: T9SS type A sorting domain-containing protein [Lewinellaceae bacterium]|nr:T9SS type A sorting domain-containing protein [Lewinellaceae bacterium]MCB9287028.1 T9SS type A sorting domain-containing protein [Lewinellaceae bacterium]
MRKYVALIAFALIGCSGLDPVSAQQAWPGDVNNNGVVNAADVLYWGLAFGSMGPARNNPTTDWQGQDITDPWPESFPNGLNYAYADCDGNGTIGENDLEEGIEENFGLSHGSVLSDGFLNGTVGNAPRIFLTPSATLVEPGASVDIGLSLGSQEFPVSGFYGIAIMLSYDNEFLGNEDAFHFEAGNNSWITAPNKDFFHHDEGSSSGKAQLAITRLDQQPQGPGFGEIGKFSIVIEDIIVGLEKVDTFRLRIDSILLIDESLNTYPVVPDTATILITKDSALVSTSNPKAMVNVQVFPNPVSDKLFIKCNTRISELLLVDALGKTVTVQKNDSPGSITQIEVSGLPGGLYWAIGRTATGSFREKIIIHSE